MFFLYRHGTRYEPPLGWQYGGLVYVDQKNDPIEDPYDNFIRDVAHVFKYWIFIGVNES